MRNPSNGELTAQLRAQQAALQELIDIALSAVRESGDSSVSSIHLIKRLNRLNDALRQFSPATGAQPMPPPSLRH